MAVGSRDPDGDSEMASSVGSPYSDSDAVDTGARTPTHNAHAAAPTSELSPPGSQPQQIPDISTTADQRPRTEAEASLLGKGPEPPVASWQTKRAQDEYQRALEQVVDKDFNLNEFGDPFDERDLEEKLL
ncbi:hypothetical protein PMG11_04763 [Penicillium brasilianum]|uniref:Uncharacterized protein n=1 Tax=Penicillium brasilianum TaxID=104259 RepID=A0A0F7VDM4_PENBI|nr:hypothetical protein PMG11_04763 [Penicillium brasilianum]